MKRLRKFLDELITDENKGGFVNNDVREGYRSCIRRMKTLVSEYKHKKKKKKSKWIKTTDRLPENNRDVLGIYGFNSRCRVMFFDINDNWYQFVGLEGNKPVDAPPKYWRELPKPPKQ